jgi:uncharacterized delta-60 repeat protein
MAPLPAGALPATYFSEDGKQTTNIGSGQKVVIQPDGKTIVQASEGLARYNEDGSLDASFAQGGISRPNVDLSGRGGIALEEDGKILVTGHSFSGDLALARLNSDGTLDTSFADGGIEVTDFDNQWAEGRGIGVQSDGKIVVAGILQTTEDGFQYLVARYTTEGLLDDSFGDDGSQLTNVDGSFARAVAIQPDDKIVVAGGSWVPRSNPNNGEAFGVVRYNSDGSLDQAFSEDGIQRTPISDYAEAYDVAIQSDGRIVLAGAASFYDSFALARYQSDGTLDTTFSGDGIRLADLDHADFVATAVTLQDDNKIVAAGGGYGPEGIGANFAVARFQPDGAWDNTFSGDGLQGTDFGADEKANDAAVQPDGKITLVGETNHNGRYAAIARYNPNGSLDAVPADPPPPSDPPPSTEPKPDPNPKPTPASSRACTITGTAHRDVLRGTSGRDVICARGGADVVYGLGGHDLIFGGTGNDRLIGGSGDDRIHGQRGRDRLIGETGRDILRGGARRDRLNTRDGIRGNDTARGGAAKDKCITNRRDLRRHC